MYKKHSDRSIYSALCNDTDLDFEMNDYKKRSLYLNSLGEEQKNFFQNSGIKHGIYYEHNSLHYRSPEFKNNTDILFSGCSMTYGYGVPLEFTWPYIVSKKLNCSYANIALLSESVTSQVRRTFAYFKKYGHPKYLIALYPDFGRIELPTNNKQFITGLQDKVSKDRSNNLTAWLSRNFLQNAHLSPHLPQIKMSARPHIAEEVLTPEISHFYSAQMILILQQYCDIAGIKFLWSTWDEHQYHILKEFKQEFPKMFCADSEKWIPDYENKLDVYDNNIQCHWELNREIDFFHFGMDRDNGIDHAHWGYHRHLHLADIVYNNINSTVD